MKTARQLKDERKALHAKQVALIEKAEAENRVLTAEEVLEDSHIAEQIKMLEGDIARYSQIEARAASFDEVEPRISSAPVNVANVNTKTKRGDDELKATAHFVRTGDKGAMSRFAAGGDEFSFDMSASNAVTMNSTTAADGAVLVPTGHYQGIIAKKEEDALYPKLGVRPLPGKGLTVNVPTETGVANLFIATAESQLFDKDAPIFSTTPITLVKFTKDIFLTVELLDEEDSKLMEFLSDYVGRALAKTHNKALVTEALANGTSITLGGSAAVTAGDPETMEFALAGEYADSAAFVMGRATEGKFRKLTGSPFQYQQTPLGGNRREFDNYPIYYSSYLAAVGSGNKSILFGDFEYMGMREGGLNFLRNPYIRGSYGEVVLHYYAYIVYKVLNADAILYGKHPTA